MGLTYNKAKTLRDTKVFWYPENYKDKSIINEEPVSLLGEAYAPPSSLFKVSNKVLLALRISEDNIYNILSF